MAQEAPDTEDTGNPRIPAENDGADSPSPDAPDTGDGEETLLSHYAGGVPGLLLPDGSLGDGPGGLPTRLANAAEEAQKAGETPAGLAVKGAGVAMGLLGGLMGLPAG
ncbi:MAG: hypothetical protein RLZZ165_1348, partial [Bacteroidota bacterium]